MKNSLLILAGAAALSLASCSQEKTTETTVNVPDGAGSTMSAADMDAMAEARAQRIADRMVADMKITDEATKTKIRTVYVNRYRQMDEMKTKYASDTTGMAAALRESMAVTDAEFKTIFADPAQYQTYESSRTTYYAMENEEPSVSTDASASASTVDASASNTESMSSTDGKVKVKADGDIKIKDADGNKLKVDGDDGTIKTKGNNGDKTKIE